MESYFRFQYLFDWKWWNQKENISLQIGFDDKNAMNDE